MNNLALVSDNYKLPGMTLKKVFLLSGHVHRGVAKKPILGGFVRF